MTNEDNKKFKGVETVQAGPLSSTYLTPDKLPMICLMFESSTLAVGSGFPGRNEGWRTGNARDQLLLFNVSVQATADRKNTDPYQNIQIINDTLADLRTFVVENDGFGGVSNAFSNVVGPIKYPREAREVQGDLLFIGTFQFHVRYRQFVPAK